MDDAPRIGGLQALLAIIGITATYVTFGAGSWGAAPFALASFAGVAWLEVYARRRAREEREERERRLRESGFAPRTAAPAEMPDDPFTSR
jgi:membrane protein implicated in regulation of membrane protease activity